MSYRTARAPRDVIMAGGGVVWRPVARGRHAAHTDAVEVALVHRPRYDDWSLPKGKGRPGEHPLATAVREVEEELGAQVAVSRWLGRTRYRVGDGRKIVDYWTMRYAGGSFGPNDEVDEITWLSTEHARERCSYDFDRDLLVEFDRVDRPRSVVILVRHARAGKRSQWSGPDDERPLDGVGRKQAARLVGVLGCFEPGRLITAAPLRCRQTIEPTAAARELSIELDPAFGDDEVQAGHTATALLALADPDRVTVVCSQGSAIPTMIEDLFPDVSSSTTRKAAVWVLGVGAGRVVSADYYTDAIA